MVNLLLVALMIAPPASAVEGVYAARMRSAREALAAGDAAAAAEGFETALRVADGPEEKSRAAFQAGVARLRAEDAAGAVKLLEQAVRLKPQNVQYLVALAMAHRDGRRSFPLLEKALGLKPGLPSARVAAYRAGEEEVRQDRHAEAAKLFRLSCRSAGRQGAAGADASAFRAIAGTCEDIGEPAAASALWSAAAAAAPGDAAPLLGVARARLALGELDKAKEWAQRAIRVTPSLDAFHLLARVERERGAAVPANRAVLKGRALGEDILRSYPDDVAALRRLARLLADFDADPDATIALEARARALSSGPEQDALAGLIALRGGRAEEAAAAFGRAASEEPLKPVFRLYEGLARAAAGDAKRASEAWRRGLEIDPSSRYLLAALEGRPVPGEPLSYGAPSAAAPAERAKAPAPSPAPAAKQAARLPGLAPAAPPLAAEPPPASPGREKVAPARIPVIAVLPVQHSEKHADVAQVLRAAFHDRISRRGYVLLPLADVDRALASPGASPREAAKRLGADALMEGTLEYFGMVELDGATQRQVRVTFRMLDARSGKTRWQGVGNALSGNVTLSAPGAPFLDDAALGWLQALRRLKNQDEILEAVHQAVRYFPRGAW